MIKVKGTSRTSGGSHRRAVETTVQGAPISEDDIDCLLAPASVEEAIATAQRLAGIAADQPQPELANRR